jgi:divalent metal cation (Fe/Co/Zn/Cd) transporter
VKFTVIFNNDGDNRQRAWVAILAAIAVILGELALLAIFGSFILLAVQGT